MDNREGHMLFFSVFHRILKKYRVINKTRLSLILFIPENSSPYTREFLLCDSSKKSSGSNRHEKVHGLTADRC